MSTKFVFSNKTDKSLSASNIDCIHLVREAGEFAYVVAPQTTFEQRHKLLTMRTAIATIPVSAVMLNALELAHGKSVGDWNAFPVGRVKRTFANDVDVMYLDDFDELVQSL